MPALDAARIQTASLSVRLLGEADTSAAGKDVAVSERDCSGSDGGNMRNARIHSTWQLLTRLADLGLQFFPPFKKIILNIAISDIQ